MEDDEEFEQLGLKYEKGELLTGEVKNILIEIVQDLLKKHQV
jgi:tryptophanyl-tRNA synthetase